MVSATDCATCRRMVSRPAHALRRMPAHMLLAGHVIFPVFISRGQSTENMICMFLVRFVFRSPISWLDGHDSWVDSPFFSTIVLSKNLPFFPGCPWKEMVKVPLELYIIELDLRLRVTSQSWSICQNGPSRSTCKERGTPPIIWRGPSETLDRGATHREPQLKQLCPNLKQTGPLVRTTVSACKY